jgi:hypothetical protein
MKINQYEWPLFFWQIILLGFYAFLGYLLYLVFKLLKKNLNK